MSRWDSVVLRSGPLSATVFLPGGKNAYYRSSRFDHGTMVGDLKLGQTTIFPSNFWKCGSGLEQRPHDPEDPESGVGLASEWGCGDRGHLCAPGWGQAGTTTLNGVLGFADANAGEPFLKIGVGKLVKSSCTACAGLGTSPDDELYKSCAWLHGCTLYQFNSPYQFFEPPIWKSTQRSDSQIDFHHAASLDTARGRMGYRIRRTVSLRDASSVVVETEVTNIGEHAFRTPFYSHHFFSVNRRPTGPPLELTMGDLDLRNYTEPLAPSPTIPKKDWSEPLAGYFAVGERGGWLRGTKPVGNHSRIKAVFAHPLGGSKGKWGVRSAGEVSVDVTLSGPLPLYAYNLYVEERTLSPEPVHMIQLQPGQSANLTHTVALRTPASLAAFSPHRTSKGVSSGGAGDIPPRKARGKRRGYMRRYMHLRRLAERRSHRRA